MGHEMTDRRYERVADVQITDQNYLRVDVYGALIVKDLTELLATGMNRFKDETTGKTYALVEIKE